MFFDGFLTPPSGGNTILLELPLVAGGVYTSPLTVNIEIDATPMTVIDESPYGPKTDSDLLIGLSDGQYLMGFLRADNNNGEASAYVMTRENDRGVDFVHMANVMFSGFGF